jgi:O-Antigen ligase
VTAGELSTGQLQAALRLRSAVVLGGGLLLAAAAGVAVGALGARGAAVALGAAAFLLLLILLWRVPAALVLVPVAMALVVEQIPLGLADRLTERVPLFRSLDTSAGLSGLHVSPAELTIASALLIWTVRGVATRRRRAGSPTALGAGLGLLVALVLAALVRGLASGGVVNIAIDEVRPFVYMAVLYLPAAEVMRRPSRLWALLWVDVLATGFKGLQGSYRYLVLRDAVPAPEAILEHEEAVFFSLFILLTAGLWLFGIRGRLRRVATCLLPFVILADLANQRRAAWIVLTAGLVLLLACAWLRCAERRRMILGVAVASTVAAAVYLPVFWNSSSTIAQPARALSSAFTPSSRDQSSDLYRVVENVDLGIDIRQSTPVGLGFGRPIPHPVPLPDLTTVDPFIDYVPHNGILYVWLRTGVPGALAFWFVVGSAMVVACRVVRAGDRRVALMGAFGVWTVAAYVLEGWFDQGLMSSRIAFLVGCVLGCLTAASRLPARDGPGR